ncbi:TPA: ABC transporter ATP-binding protein [Listeria monocytogenes]|uniref:ABC transporter ATP-binding protein n=3 Tax=Listeria monocytogenes TaxID=1639 RepID=UPI0004324FA2|nr:ABC transporter ATP-binding protein [Listeria monocytogenes]EHC5296085.1 ABC transporter ATP-binding protein [Listeria monocytogenes serotype 1/2a]EAC2209766.1 ABC transporter ATP-binding protein [Listeria monocytogenes]EAC3065325.1 ABC transporter ATP-binding protein [Listeria monocytogenes]EAC4263060.1 ABC transporter ATP-binding protein [Listeria monocytogenes]EAC4767323.1 ABC transporter ATP-binding protein [Listeria monocytogenes]
MERLIYVDKATKYYGNKGNVTKALSEIEFEISEGEFTGIMGASGSGKSTLLAVLSTIDRLTSGHIYFEGEDITQLNEEQLADFREKKLGFVFQDFNLLDTLTIEENISLAMTLQNKDHTFIQDRVQKIMAQLNITDIRNKFPYEVSGGQKQRCACARAIINQPKIIMADEPTGALDSKSAELLLNTFVTMNEEMKTTLLMVTHDAFSASYCNRILFLKDGEIFNELIRGNKSRREFLNTILDVLSINGGGLTNVE